MVAIICCRLRWLCAASDGIYSCLLPQVRKFTCARADLLRKIQTVVEPFHRMFSLDNMAIQFPHAAVERVPASMDPTFAWLEGNIADQSAPGWNIGYAGVLPLLILIFWAAVLQPGIHKVHVTILGLFISLILTSFLTDVVKNSVGRPRPDLLDRCKAAKGTPEHTLVTIDVCTETDHHILHDGWRSFPSGHSSFAFSGLGYLALYDTFLIKHM